MERLKDEEHGTEPATGKKVEGTNVAQVSTEEEAGFFDGRFDRKVVFKKSATGGSNGSKRSEDIHLKDEVVNNLEARARPLPCAHHTDQQLRPVEGAGGQG